MLLFFKCLKVSLEVILDNREKNSSGCFAWSWKVSVPKKVSGKTRGKEGGGKRGNCFGAWSASSPRASTVHEYQKKPFQGLLGGDISVCGGMQGGNQRCQASPGAPEHPLPSRERMLQQHLQLSSALLM